MGHTIALTHPFYIRIQQSRSEDLTPKGRSVSQNNRMILMIRRTIPRTGAAACNLRLWSFPSSDVFLTSLKLLGTEPARKVRKSSRAGFPASFGNGFFIQISKKDV